MLSRGTPSFAAFITEWLLAVSLLAPLPALGQTTNSNKSLERAANSTVTARESSDEAANRQQLVVVPIPELNRWGKHSINCHFVVMSDTHVTPKDPGSLGYAMGRLKSEKPDFVIFLGDLTGYQGQPDSVKLQDFKTFLTATQKFGRPVYLLPGNTDINPGDDTTRLFRIATKMKPFYSFDSGGVHFVVLFTEKRKPERFGIVDETELDWLKADLSRLKSGTPIILFSHHALYSEMHLEGEDDNWGIDNAAELEEVLKPYHLIATFSGHRHLNRMSLDSRKVLHVLTGSMARDLSDNIGPKHDGIGYRWVSINDYEIRTAWIRMGS